MTKKTSHGIVPTSMALETLVKIASDLSITLSDKQIEQFSTYQKDLLDWNTRINLTGIKDPVEIEIKHFADSLTILDSIPKEAHRLADIGTGAGFPGIPIAIMRPDIEVVLFESVGKKCSFLEHIVNTLELKNCTVVNMRAEDAAKQEVCRNTFNVVTARAVSHTENLITWGLDLLASKGIMILQKSSDAAIQESDHVKNLLRVSRLDLMSIKQIHHPSFVNKSIIILKKNV